MKNESFPKYIFILIYIFTFHTFAQDSEYEGELKSIDSELEKQMPKEVPRPKVNTDLIKKGNSTINYSEVKSTIPYSDLAVVQKNYMPKTDRFQLTAGLSLAPNDVFYRTMGLNLRAGYHFSETWGVELIGILLNSSRTEEINGLESKQKISVENLVTPKNYLGLNVYFNSIYGKAAFSEKYIIPFEIYQVFGVGKVTTANTSGATGIYFGIGDVFSRSRNGAWKIDLSMLIYNSTNINGDNQSSNTLFLTFGYGHFFPEAGRR